MIIKYAFSGMGRRVSKILRNVDKDYSKRYTNQLKTIKTVDMQESYIDLQNKDQKLHHLTKPHNFNKALKQEYNDVIDKAVEIEVERIKREEIEDKSIKWLENNYMANEVKKFEQILFQKNERLRLLKKEDQRIQNYLPIELLQQQGETEYIKLHQEHQKYQSTLNQLQNQRITEMRENINNPYGDLQKSQLLIQYPNLKPLIEQHIQKIEQNQPDSFVAELKEKVDSSNSLIDWDSVKSFYVGMQQQRQNGLVTFSKHQQSVSVIQDYQNFLMDKFYNNTLQMRTKGKIQFSDLTEEECVRYIIYDIKETEILMRLITTMDLIPDKFTSKVSSTILQKIATQPHDNLLLLKDERYRILLNYIARAQFDDQNLAQTIYALTLLNPRAINTVYDRLSYHLYDSLSNQLVSRIGNFTTSQYAMICRNFNQLPISQDLQLQHIMTQDIIKNRVNQELSVFDAESFINFLSKPLISDQSLTVTIQNLTHTLLSHPKAHLEMDGTTLKYLSMAIFHMEDTKNLSQLIKKNATKFQLAVQFSECNHLSAFALALSKLDINKNNQLCQYVKSRFITIMTEKKKVQDETDIAILISALTQIDIKSMYPTRRVNEILLLQTVFNRYPYALKSAFHTPYEKLLNVMKNYGNMFQDQNLVIIMHSLLTVSHFNKDAMNQAIDQVKDVQYLFPLYTNMNTVDKIILEKLLYRFSQQKFFTIQGLLYYLQMKFHYNILTEEDFNQIKLEHIEKLDQTSLCFLVMLLTSVKITDQIKKIYLKAKPFLNPQFIEQKYLLLLARVACNYEQSELSYTLTQIREQATQRNKEIGIEMYLPHQVIQQVADLYEKNGHKVQKNMQLPLVQADLLIDNQVPILFLSVNEMIDDNGQFDFTGMQRLLKKRTNIKYILYEEFIRSPDQLQFILELL